MKHRSHRAPGPHRSGPPRQAGPTPAEIDGMVALYESAQWEQMEDRARKMTARHPGHAFGWHTLSLALEARGGFQEAIGAAVRAITLAPNEAGMHRALGNVLRQAGRLAEAEICYRRALALQPGDMGTHNNLGLLLLDLGRYREAGDCFSSALGIDPTRAGLHYNLGNALRQQDRSSEAEACYRRAIEIAPDYAEAHCGLGNTLRDFGRLAEAEACYRRAIGIRPDYADAQGFLMFSIICQIGPVAACCDEAFAYGRRTAERVRERFTAWNCTDRPGRLRVGLVSGDLCRHSVGSFLDGVLARIDPDRIELIAYPTTSKDDDLTARLRRNFSSWTPLVGLDDEAAARRVHADGVHVLMDLSGYTPGTRLPVFARKPAPVQATWLGYSGTTGFAEMDWLIADPHVAPPEEEWQYTERLWRLPETYLCFTPPDADVAVGPLPAIAAAGPTFGSFNNLAKMNDAVVALWSRVLDAVPCARLFLKAQQLSDEAIREATLRRFAACGIGPERLQLEGHVAEQEDHLAAYNRVDIALDPFPYTGTTTCIEGLWMGVPFITRRGDRFLSHVGEGIAHSAGLSDWIAADQDDYVAKAVAFAADLDRLAALRAGLRGRLLTSPLLDAPRFARHLEDALWGMWEERVKGQG